MAYEFKRLSDVDVVAEPTETANVLIEENGVIKKAPKTAVGGAGGIGWDAIINCDGGHSLENISLVHGSYDELKAKLIANEMPMVCVTYNYEYGDMYYCPSTVIYMHIYNNLKNIDEAYIHLYWMCDMFIYDARLNYDGSFSEVRQIRLEYSVTDIS